MEEQLRSPVRYSGANQQQQKQQLFKDHSHDGSGHDSGYTSYQSFNASCSVARSVLATIEEDNEADSSFEEPARKVGTSSILTPTTTASLEMISNFHLTTPNSASKENMLVKRRTLARKPTCQNLFAMRTPEKSAGGSSEGTPVRSARKSAEVGVLTPRKNKTSAKRKHGSFREKLYSDGDAESLENDCKKLEDISPIFHNKRRRNSVIDDFIRSSTPKTAGFNSNFHVETQENLKPANRKGLVLRKFQSFSPSKMSRKRDTVLQEKSLLTNRKAPLQRQNAIQTTPQKRSPEVSLELSFTVTPERPNLPKPSTISALLDAPILPSTSVSAEESLKPDLNQEVSQLPSFTEDDSVLRDVPAPRRSSIPSLLNAELESPTLFSPTIPPRTPKSSRKLKRLSSTSAKKDRPKPATSPKHRTVHPVIPGTYRTRRNYDGVERLNILKRLNEHDKDALEIVLGYLADSDLVRVVSVSRSWRAIIESNRRLSRRLRDYLAKEAHSKENFDRSESVGKDESKVLLIVGSGAGDGGKLPPSVVVARQPFSLCNSIDGNHSVVNVSVAAAPKSPPVSPSRRKFHENQKIASHLKKSERLKPCPRCGKPSRVVAAQTKTRSTLGSTSKSSTAAAKLEKSYTLPEAAATSHVISPPPSPPPPSSSSSTSPGGDGSADRIRRNLFSTSMLFPSRACSVDSGGATPVVRGEVGTRRSSSDATPLVLEKKRGHQRRRQSSVSSSSTEESQCDYAVCSGKGCGFTFCVKCLCEHHPDAICKDLAPNSPSKEDAPVQYVACSKQSRRSLLRLCK